MAHIFNVAGPSVAGPNVLVDAGARLLTPAVREIYAVLLRVGVIVVHD